MFALQTREQISKSNLNNSKSKQLWSFSKTKRFVRIKTQCPVAFYQHDYSTITKKQIRFASSKRKVFTQTTDAPLPGNYQPFKQKVKNVPLFGESRDKCIFRSYVSREIAKNPGPNKYQGEALRKSRGISMRPKTANQRNYFIDDKQRNQIPGPATYNLLIQRDGISTSSKFRSTLLGNFGLKKTQKRFPSFDNKIPGPSSYLPKSVGLKSQKKSATIGNQLRKSFIDIIKKNTTSTGPGNYELPTQFGHYLQIHSIALGHEEN